MRIFTLQFATTGSLAGVYNSLDALEFDWPIVIEHPDNYIVIESLVNVGILNMWQAVTVNGKVYWEVIAEAEEG
jgi:hypothetical protein